MASRAKTRRALCVSTAVLSAPKSKHGIGWQEIQTLRHLGRSDARACVPRNTGIVRVGEQAFRVSDAQSSAARVWVSHFG